MNDTSLEALANEMTEMHIKVDKEDYQREKIQATNEYQTLEMVIDRLKANQQELLDKLRVGAI